jgi:hypothetical protein
MVPLPISNSQLPTPNGDLGVDSWLLGVGSWELIEGLEAEDGSNRAA